MSEKNPLIPEIIKRKTRGETYTDMAENMGVSRKTLYNIRTSDSYIKVVDEMFTSLMDEIEELIQSDQHTVKVDGVKEKGRILRALLPSLSVVQHRKDPETERGITAEQIIAERKRADKLIRALKLTPEQMKVLEANVISEGDYE